jgi:hypothetical protein
MTTVTITTMTTTTTTPTLLAAALLLCIAASATTTASAAAAAPNAAPNPTAIPEIGASVMLLGKYDWELSHPTTTNKTTTTTTTTWSRCLDQLRRASNRTNSRDINFVLTHHWVPSSSPKAPISQHCLMHGTDGRPKCYAWSQELIDQLRDSLAVCFAEAMRMGFTISVRPHLDDASPTAHGATLWPLTPLRATAAEIKRDSATWT